MNKKIIIGIVAVLIVGLSGWKIWTDNSSSEETKDTQVYNSEISAEKENDNIGNNKSKNKKSIYPNNDADKNSSSDENNNKNESTENKNKSDMEDKKSSQYSTSNNEISQVNSSKISLPYKVGTTELEITKIQKYSGKFVEDGSDKEVSNILALIVKNTSNKDLQYGQIILSTDTNDNVEFNITNLPAKSSAIVLESTGSIPYTKNLSYKNSTYASVNSLPMDTKKIKVTTETESGIIEQTASVVYSEQSPVLEELKLYYWGHDSSMNYYNRVFDLTDKTQLQNTITFNPNYEYTFTVKMSNREKINNLYVTSTRNGTVKYLKAEWNNTKGCYVTSGKFDGSNSSLRKCMCLYIQLSSQSSVT